MASHPAVPGLPIASASAADDLTNTSTNSSVSANSPVAPLSSHLSAASITSSCDSAAGGDSNPRPSVPILPHNGAIAANPVASSNVGAPASLLDSDNPPLGAMAPSGALPPPSDTPSKPTTSTGAIPKSISFDKNVLESSQSFDDPKSKSGRDRGNFFKSFKLPKIGRSRGGGNSADSSSRSLVGSSGSLRSGSVRSEAGAAAPDRCLLTGDDAFNIPEHAEGPALRRATSDETSDDILAKYRKKSASHTDSAASTDPAIDPVDVLMAE